MKASDKKLNHWRFAAVFVASASLICPLVGLAQEQRGDWAVTGGDAGQNGWQKDEQGLSPETAAAKFKFLWKIKLGEPAKGARSFSEPVMAGRLINAEGFKDIVYWSSSNTLFAVDSELGALIWKKQYDLPTVSKECGVSSLGVLMEPPVVINFAARRKRAPGVPRPPDPPAAKTTERRLGVAPGGGYFGLKGIYVLTPDGMLHEQVMTTGADFAAPVKFLPSAGASPYGLNFASKTLYTATGHGCGGISNGIWAIDLSSADYPVAHYSTGTVEPLSLTGPVITQDDLALLVTGAGNSDGNQDSHPGSVLSLGKDLKIKDWYTPEKGIASYEHISPITFDYKGKRFVVAPGEDGRIALLSATSLGGENHHTPHFQTSSLYESGEKHGWDGFASWEDKDGTPWVFASISAALHIENKSAKISASNPHGGVMAFKAEDINGKLELIPMWVSGDMVNPAPPRLANGVLVALAGGDQSTHAKLFVLNAMTGAELYSSKDEIPTYTDLSGVSVGDSHAFFTDHDNTLYSFGIGLEH